jgi:dipeptidyl aminopeptidase/acylaminoacyl peptidase
MIGRRGPRSPGRPIAGAVWLLVAWAVLAPPHMAAQAQSGSWDPKAVLATEHYTTPPQSIVDAVMAPRWLNVTLTDVSPNRKWFLDEIGDGPVTMDRFSKPFHDLGGEFIDFRANRDRNLTIRSNVGIDVISAADGSSVSIRIPAGARVSNATWSPDGSQIAFFVHTPDATSIWVADPANGRSRQITRTPVLATLVTRFQWTADGKKIATVLVPDGRAPMPVKPTLPTGPEVEMTQQGENHLRTYRSLMATPYDKALLEWDATGQLALVDVASRKVEKVGAPAMIWAFDFSPDGQYARVTKLDKPFSYMVPVSNFAKTEEIWDRTGKKLAVLDETPMNTGLQGDNVAAPGASGGRGDQRHRQVAWREDNQGLTFLEQEPAPPGDSTAAGRGGGPGGGGRGAAAGGGGEEGQQGGRARRRDRVMQWAPPFDSASLKAVYESTTRIDSHNWAPDYKTLFLTQRQGQNTVVFAVRLSDPSARHTLVRYRSDDFYANPGSLVLTGGAAPRGGRGGGGFGFGRGRGGGETVQLSSDGQHVFFYGTQYDKDPLTSSPKSFLDEVAMEDGAKQRVYESSNDNLWEHVTAFLDIDAGSFVVERESSTEVPQDFLHAGGKLTRLTHNKDYTPDLTAAKKERFVVERPDGFRFLVNVTLPPGYTGGRLPAMFWFYPREYTSQSNYDESGRTYNKNAFTTYSFRSMQFLARLGYAVVEPDAPIVGKTGQMNDNYDNDLRNNLSAVIDELDRRGIIDRQRLAIGGHSYGAFSTANALVHTPFFKAGIAGDGNYNRTLTPLDFQNERRTFWEAKDVYISMSPFFFANQMTGALLMYHGLHDQNVGTDPINTPRMFQALNGLNKDAAMYLYPYEDHGPAAKATLLDLWARWTAWLDVHLAPGNEKKAASDGSN